RLTLKDPRLCENVRGRFLLLNDIPEQGTAVNAKSAAAGSIGRRRRKRDLVAELGGQPVGGGLHDLGAALQSLDGEPPDRARNPQCANDLAGEILHGNRDAADLEIELAVVEGDAAASDVFDLTQQG